MPLYPTVRYERNVAGSFNKDRALAASVHWSSRVESCSNPDLQRVCKIERRSVMNSENQSGSRFIVDLGAVKLAPIMERQVEAEIQAVVLRALADSNVGSRQPAQDSVLRAIWD